MTRCLILIMYFVFAQEVLGLQVTRLAVIGDYGEAGPNELAVANLVKSWAPDLIITTGDNNYPNGEATTIDTNIGQYYHEFISPYTGLFGKGDTVNRFFPSLGNHDWNTPGAVPYLNYFTLPGNERYYDFTAGPVHLFAVDSDPHEPDGNTSASLQANWLQARLTSSSARWKIVYLHHAPYSSGSTHGSNATLRWPFAAWGATAVLAGHEHNFERIFADSIVYFVNGLGGRSLYPFGTPIAGSQARYNADYGAMLVEASTDSITFAFFNKDTVLIDRSTIHSPTVDVREDKNPEGFRLSQNYPNPFNPTTTFSFHLPSRSFVTLRITDSLGREISTLVAENLPAGTHTRVWNASGAASGLYFCQLHAGNFRKTQKLVLIK